MDPYLLNKNIEEKDNIFCSLQENRKFNEPFNVFFLIRLIFMKKSPDKADPTTTRNKDARTSSESTHVPCGEQIT